MDCSGPMDEDERCGRQDGWRQGMRCSGDRARIGFSLDLDQVMTSGADVNAQ
jgi:hypothetical protein